jgi:hypothetical protein
LVSLAAQQVHAEARGDNPSGIPSPVVHRAATDCLEDRTVPSTLTVLNNSDSGAGWLCDTLAAAQSGDTIVFDNSVLTVAKSE